MPQARSELRSMTGPQRAAIIMMALSEEHAARLFGMMDDEEIREISTAMSNLGQINSEIVESLFLEFAERLSSTGSLVGTYESTERLLGKVLGDDRVNQIMEEIRGPAGRTMWDKLSNVNEQVLATYLKNEYPQTVAVVMAKLKPDHAARVLAMLPENLALEVINRMLRMQTVQKDVLDHVERTLRAEFMTNLARTTRHESHEQIAEIFNSLD
ncbi:MAG: flagellar motor switch protein FliG, partial [Alphaproteobacteria bacterium]